MRLVLLALFLCGLPVAYVASMALTQTEASLILRSPPMSYTESRRLLQSDDEGVEKITPTGAPTNAPTPRNTFVYTGLKGTPDEDCREGCSGHGVCRLITPKGIVPLKAPTIHMSGCECAYPEWAGPDCSFECPTVYSNVTIERTIGTNDTAAYVARLEAQGLPVPNSTTFVEIVTEVRKTICNNHGKCDPFLGTCDCQPQSSGFAGPACQYECPRARAHGNQVCGGSIRGNCTWRLDQDCHPFLKTCNEKGSKNFGVKCECRPDTRGPDCNIDCPKDEQGRICSNNGTCDISGICRCNTFLEGDRCQYGILNDTYRLQSRWIPTQLTSRRMSVMTAVNWHWKEWNDVIEVEVTHYESLAVLHGGVGRASSAVIDVFDPKTKEYVKEEVTLQFSYQEMFYWNHTAKYPPSEYGIFGLNGHKHHLTDIGRHWDYMHHQCYYADQKTGARYEDDCTEQDLANYVPSKRYGHTLITLGDNKHLMMYGGYSSICADYCNDLWMLDLSTRIWTFVNMSTIPSPRYLTDDQYEQLYGLNAPKIDYRISGPVPSKRWLHSMSPVNETSLIMFGGYYGEVKWGVWLNDVWVYTLNVAETPQAPSRFAENKGLWKYYNSSNWGNQKTHPGSGVPAGRRAHVSAFIDGKLYIHGGQVYSGVRVNEVDGRESKSRSTICGEDDPASRKLCGAGDIWMWSMLENQWYPITPITLDGIPNPRYSHASYQFKDAFVIHGGYSDPEYWDDMWAFNATTLSWTKVDYGHRNRLVYNPRPQPRFGHSMALVNDAFLIFGGFGQACVYEAQSGTDPDDRRHLDPVINEWPYDKTPPYDADPDATEINYFCMPDLQRYPEGHKLAGQPKWFDEVTGELTEDVSLQNAGATRLTTDPLYYGDTWVFNHTRCPEDCNHEGYCNLNFCICNHNMPTKCDSHECVRETYWGSFVLGTSKAQWGYHCRFKACHNTSCYYNYTHQHEFCRHCQYQGSCDGLAETTGLTSESTARCVCDAKHEHILPINYQMKKISPYGPSVGPNAARPMTAEPVPFYAEEVPFQLDERRRKDCQYNKCPHQFCNGHGYCMREGVCHCDPEYIGVGCEYHAFCPSGCNYQGLCLPRLRDPTMPWKITRGGLCHCHGVFNGSTCQIAERNFAVDSKSVAVLCYLAVLLSFHRIVFQ